MDLDQLKYFRVIAENGSISKAAESLYLSQPALSKSLSKLEEELGTPLFLRVKNKIYLQPAGKTLLQHAKNIQAEIDALQEDLQRPINKENIITIASSSNATEHEYVN